MKRRPQKPKIAVNCRSCGTPFFRSFYNPTKNYCSRKCNYARWHRPGLAEARFWTKVDKRGPDECWLWTGCTYNCGYGSFKFAINGGKSKMVAAHRASYNMFKGHIPDGLDVCHSCDQPLCVNPAHLWLGTAKDNMADMHRKGRHPYTRNKVTA